MRGRTGVLITVLVATLSLAGLACWVLLSPAAVPPGHDPTHRAARSGDFNEEEARLAEEEARRKAGRPEDGLAESDLTRAARGPGAGADGTAAADLDGLPPEVINPDEINAPVPGHLIIRVLDRSEDRPLPGANVHYPVRGSALAAEGGDVKISESVALTRKRTNKHGVCVWSAKEIAQLRNIAINDPEDTRMSVLVTHVGYADLFEPLALPDMSKGAEVTLHLFSAVRVSGKVREKKGGSVKYASVDVLQTSSQGDAKAPLNRFTVKTDAMGEFALKVADAYTYRFEVKTAGYAPYESREFDFRRDERTVSIILLPARGVGGLVTDKDGKGIEGATVESRNDKVGAVTDAEGRFAIDMIRDGVWSNDVVLRFSAKGYAPQTRRVLANDNEIKVQLEAEGTLTVTCLDEKGQPAPGATVSCVFIEGRSRTALEAITTNAEGRAVFGGMGEGRAQVSAQLESLVSDPANVAVKPGANADVTLNLRLAATITGRVTSGGVAVANATITIGDAPAGATDESGTFTLTGLAAGDHQVGIVNQFPITDAQLRQMPVFTTDGKAWYFIPAKRKVRAQLGKTEIVDFEVPPFDAEIDRKITVNIRTQPLEPVQGVQVSVKPVLGSPPAGVAVPQTLGLALDLPEGRAEMPLSLLNGVSYEVLLNHNQYFPAKLDQTALGGIKDGGSIEIVLERAFVIKGYVRDSQGSGIEGVGLSRDRNNPWAQSATTNIHGYFEFGQLREGDYLVTAFKHGYYQEKTEVKVAGIEPDPLAITLVGANEIRIVVKNGGSPQPGAQVDIYRNDAEGENPDDYKRHFNIGTTDANGLKYINFHWVRNYQIVARHGSLIGFANFNNLKEVPEREFVIQLEQGFDLGGTVVDADTQAPLTGVTVRANAVGGTGAGNFFQVQTDGAGNFAFRVPAGDFWFYVPKTGSHQALSTQGSSVAAGSTGHVLNVPLREDIQGNYAQIIAFSAPGQMVGGQQYNVTVTVKNVGNTTWTSAGNQPWRLGSQSPRDNKKWGMSRVPIPDGVQVAPKQTVSFQFTVTAPAQPGNHAMQWQMVQDGREWFGQMTQKLSIAVTAPEGG